MPHLARVSHSKRKGSAVVSRYVFVFGTSILIVTAMIVLLVSLFSPSIINPMLQSNPNKKITFIHIPINSTTTTATVSPSLSSSPERVNSSDQTNQKVVPFPLFKEILKNSTQTRPLKVKESIFTDEADFSVKSTSRLVSRKRKRKSQKKTSTSTRPRLDDEMKKEGNGDDCNIFDGEWVWVDNRKPYYPPGSCPFIEEGSNFNCYKNGKTDGAYLNWQWQWQSQQTNAACNSTIP
ncbi:hypothetical protein MKW94_014731, partial [Papaver nudicaule]|nr:hypothetical protein [Papaver nudicaule]